MSLAQLANRWIQFKVVLVSWKKAAEFSKKPIAMCKSLGLYTILINQKLFGARKLDWIRNQEVNIVADVRERVKRFYCNKRHAMIRQNLAHLIIQIEGLGRVFLSFLHRACRELEYLSSSQDDFVLLR